MGNRSWTKRVFSYLRTRDNLRFNYNRANFPLNPSEKQIKWHSNVGSPLVSSPLLHNGILVAATYDSWIKGTSFTGKNFVFGIDTRDRKQIWGFEIPGDIFSSPCLVDDMTIVVGSISNAVYALEGYSGNILWKFETGGEVWSSPSYNGNEIFIGSDDCFLYCLDIDGKLLSRLIIVRNLWNNIG